MSVPRILSKTNTYRSQTGSTARTSSSTFLTSSQRNLNKKEFAKCYVDLCHYQHFHPLQMVKQHLDNGILDIVADRIKFEEWYPILSALRWDQTLHRVAIRLRYRALAPIWEADTDFKARSVTKQPVILTKYLLYWLLEAIKNFLHQSPVVTDLLLEGIPLNGELTAILAEGLMGTRSLQHLRLIRCATQDDGIEAICLAVRNAPTIIELDLSNCQLTEVGALSVARLISLQKLARYSEAWKQTLRYRDPDVEAMAGLRRLTLNDNPELGDRGIQAIAEEARDDLWLRALDLQNTGLSDYGALHLVHLVRSNPNLVVVDARKNVAMSPDSLSEIMAVLAINNADKDGAEYGWIRNGSENISGDLRKSSKLKRFVPLESVKSVSSLHRSHSTLMSKEVSKWRKLDEAQANENIMLRQQVRDLNDMLNHEVRNKSDLLRENNILKGEVEQLRRRLEEVNNNLVLNKDNNNCNVSKETIVLVENTLSQLAAVCSQDQNAAEIGELLENMRRALNLADEVENDGDHIRRRMKSRIHQQQNDVIWEQDEPLSSHRNVHYSAPIKTKKAQDIFAKMIGNREKFCRKTENTPCTSDEESS